MRVRSLLLAIPLCASMDGAQRATPVLPYRNTRLSIERRVSDLLSRLTREEKFWQLYMAPGDLDDPAEPLAHSVFGLQIRLSDTTRLAARRHAERINAIQRHFVEETRWGIPIIAFEEALHGVMAHGATVFPQAIGLAATWDTALVRDVAGAIAREARSRGIRDVLSPVLNLASDVRWGRVEETYGEDPWLASRMGLSYIVPIEGAGIVTTPKHFVANVGAGGRDSYPIERDARALEELEFVPFRAAVREGGARSLMTAYNSVAGVPATQSRWLLTDVLKRGWGFSGFVISDASATGGATVLHMTAPSTAVAARDALSAGLDVIFQGGRREAGPYLEAVRQRQIPDAVLDEAARRVLRAKFQLGLFERPYVDPDSAAYWNEHDAHRALALQAARESMVLLRNHSAVLPIASSVRSIAVSGVDATEQRSGGYSGSASRYTSLLGGIVARAGTAVQVRHSPGPGRMVPQVTTVPASALSADASGTTRGLRGAYFDDIEMTGTPAAVRVDSVVDMLWTLSRPAPNLPLDWYSVRWTGTLTAADGLSRLGVSGTDGYRLFVDDTLRIDRWRKESAGTHLVPVRFAPGSRHTIRLEYHESRGNARVRLVWDAGVQDDSQARIDAAVADAAQSDLAVVVVGIEEGEFRDRASLALPGRQEDLIRSVAATGRPTVVVLVGGSAVTMSRWIHEVAAVVQVWYPGQEGGRALADVLWGDYSPAGRLPITVPLHEGQLPLPYYHRPTGRGDDYVDLPGAPLFPFGHGLSYTTFGYTDLKVSPATPSPSGRVTVTCTVRNVGARRGDEVVQLYLRDELASTARPVLQLAGFRRLSLAAGEAAEVTFVLGPEHLRMLDASGRWVVEPGRFRVLVGSSSTDLRLKGSFDVRQVRR